LGLGLIESEKFHLVGVIDLALDLVGDRFADRTLHLELGGSAVLNADAQESKYVKLSIDLLQLPEIKPPQGLRQSKKEFSNPVINNIVIHDPTNLPKKLKKTYKKRMLK
jgi:hypothetical protein